MDFKNAEELLSLCHAHHMSIADVMRAREMQVFETTEEEIEARMWHSYEIMGSACHEPLISPQPSMGGLLGGEAAKLNARRNGGETICGSRISKAAMYALAVLEVNASMGVIVAAPTAGSSGVLPAVLLTLEEDLHCGRKQILDGLFTAGAIGYLGMRNASVSGAEAGCQAEVGVASAMAAAAAVAMMGGSPAQCMDAATMAISNLLGLVCDPVAGLVEYPCQTRNVLGATNALTSAELVLAGITSFIPLDQMLSAMLKVGRALPFELRETALGGCAATAAGCSRACQIFGKTCS